MLRPRVVPCLLLKDGGLVKTVRFADPTYVGDPVNTVKLFNEMEADELLVLDIDATARGAEPDYKLIGQLAAECRMPLCYGGGIKSAAQGKRIVSLGAEKVAVGSAAIENPRLLSELAAEIGSQSVVLVLDVRESGSPVGYEVFVRNGREATGRHPVALAAAAQALGAGEILVNSIDRDGTRQGYDLALGAAIRSATRLPFTMLGGAGSLADMAALIERCGVVGAAAGSLFVFKGTRRAVLISYPSRAQREELVRALPNP